MNNFADRLLAWFELYGRKDLPWQKDVTPYRVWVSEIMLQQTQVLTVIPYFERFMQSFPDVSTLADAAQDDVLSHWSGLGYYARARNLHKAALKVRDDYGGRFPNNFDDVVALPGIGRSTAGAILSLASDQHHAILDGNVKRVLARHRAIAGWPGKTSVQKALWAEAEQLTPSVRVAEYTQAIMDLGATLCRRTSPDCERCPVSIDCRARLSSAVGDYPGRKVKQKKPLKCTTMIIASCNDEVFLERRPEAGIWGGLWSLPELGTRSLDEWCSAVLGSDVAESRAWDVLRHSFSHYDLDIQPIQVSVQNSATKLADSTSTAWVRIEDDPPGGMAAPVRKLIEQLKKSEDVTHY